MKPPRRALVLAALLLFPLLALELELRLRPYPREQLRRGSLESLRLRDRTGVLLREAVNAQGERARWTPLEQMNPLLVQATLAVEDHRFFQHRGIDFRALLRAALADLAARRVVQGGSTLSMQLSRRLAPRPRTLWGKLSEMHQALKLERALSKGEILEQYLNRAPYGADAVGVEAASLRYFGKPGAHLSLAEAALLAGLPKAPAELNPLRNPGAALARRALVLERMRVSARARPEEIDSALREPLQLARGSAPAAMHFTDWVRAGLPQPQGEVLTTLDLELQRELEAMVADHVHTLQEKGVTNASLVVLDNSDCSVLAMIGSADYWRGGSGAVNGALSRRQPGSTLKPFLYALAFELGDTPATVVADIETRYGEVGGELYVPQNFSRDFSGPVLMGEALGKSLNVPAIRVARRVGAQALLERLRRAGFASLEESASHYGLGLALGNGEVTLLELAQGYAMLARGGRACRARALAASPPQEGEQVFSPREAYLVSDILSDEVLRMRAFGPNNALMLPFPLAAKTGTSTNWRDNWAVGYTPRYTVAVWAGDFEGRPLDQLAGAAGAGPLFHRAMARVALRNGQPRPEKLPRPEEVAEITVCASSGLFPTPLCPEHRAVRVPREGRPGKSCDHHRRLPVDVRNGLLAGEKCPRRYVRMETFEVLPSQYAEWQRAHGRRAPRSQYSPLCPARGVVPRAVVITWPRANEVFLLEPGYSRSTQSLELAAEVDPPAPRLSWRVDGEEVASAGWPYQARWALSPGRHRLEAWADGRRSEAVEVEVR